MPLLASETTAGQAATGGTPRHRTPLVAAIAAATLASGVANLCLLASPALPERLAVLYGLIPVEFVALSRFLTLVVGFALVMSSLNLYRRKRRAAQAVAALASLSIALHLAKGVDYEEALASAALLALLAAGWRRFTVRSRAPAVRAAAVRLAATLAVGTGYGVAGFWLLDPREFGIDFSLVEALRQTLSCLALSPDPRLVAHTRHAAWFLDSLALMTAVMVVYAASLLFRPVLYRLRTRPLEHAAAGAIVREHGRSSLDFFKVWPDKSYFFSASGRAFLAYGCAGGFALVLGDPVGPAGEIEPVVRQFARFCDDNGWGFAFYQTLPDFVPDYRRCGLSTLKLGDDAVVDLRSFNTDGPGNKGLRSAVHKIGRLGYEARRHDPPLSDGLLADLQRVSDEWLQTPGHRERGFTLGRFDRDYLRDCPVYVVADKNGIAQAFVNVIPSSVGRETTIDLMRHRKDLPHGVMDFLLARLLFDSRDRGFERFAFGLAPLSGFGAAESASTEERAIHAFFTRLTFIFRYAGIRAYKAKFATGWEPRYIVHRGSLDLPRVAVTLARLSEIR